MIGRHLPFFSALLVFLCLVIRNPFSTQHQLLNLEPYPDGLFYVGTALNVSQGKGLTLTHQDSVLKPKIPPAYALFLSFFYSITIHPATFYVANGILTIITLFFLYLTLRNTTTSPLIQAGGLILYLLHAYIPWFVSLPMSENLGLALVSIILWCFSSKESHPNFIIGKSLIVTITAAALIFTKYVYIPVAVLSVLVYFIIIHKGKHYSALKLMIVSGSVAAVLFIVFLQYVDFNPFIAFSSGARTGGSDSNYFDLSLWGLLKNNISYLTMFMGQKSLVLWQTHAVSTLGISIPLSLIYAKLLTTKINYTRVSMFLTIAFAPLVLLQFFYVIDGRYLVTAILSLVVCLCFILESIRSKIRPRFLLFLIFIIVGFQAISQLTFYRQILSSNILNRSKAWQYEATIEVDALLQKKKNSYLISTLPPYLFEFYGSAQRGYSILPVSSHQEFLDKNQFVWGDTINYSNLPDHFRQLILEGKEVYITNAYLSHSREVEKDYESLKNQFWFDPVSSGCLDTCAVYRLKLL